jgi:phosphate transport system protein
MPEIRRHFHDDMAELERLVLQMGEEARDAVSHATRAIIRGDTDEAEVALEEKGDVDEQALEFERLWLQTMALQTPVAVDLRTMSVLQSVAHSVVRVAAQAGNIARIVMDTADMPRDDVIVAQLREMGEHIDPMLRMAFEAIELRDPTVHARLDELDDPVDAISRNMYGEVVRCADDEAALAWATRALIASRAFERVGDRSVSIAEQVVFLVSGEVGGTFDDDVE